MLTLLWVPVTLVAAAAQTARNAVQRRLTETIGTAGATQVRFLYGFPFALVFLAGVVTVTGQAVPRPDAAFFAYVTFGAFAQVLGTAMMLAAMRERSFATVTAYLKTEPVQVAVFGLAVLGDRLSLPGLAAIVIATSGVILMAWRPGGLTGGGFRPVALGLAGGAAFAIAAIGFRGAILALGDASFVLRATTALAWGLGLQTLMLGVWLAAFDRAALRASLGEWRHSLFAGFLGAFASQFWFIGFALTTAANVRTLALVEVIMAHAVSRRFLSQQGTRAELAGMALVIAGVALLLLLHA